MLKGLILNISKCMFNIQIGSNEILSSYKKKHQ